MVIVEYLERPLTFFHLPKNAGTSISNWLVKHAGGEYYEEEMKHEVPSKLTGMFDDFGYSFCCVRNPYDRYVSWYKFFNRQDKMQMQFNTFLDAVIAVVEDHRAKPQKNKLLVKYIRPMTDQLQTTKDVDVVIRYENLVEDFKAIQEMVSCHEPLEIHNSTKKVDYKDYWTEDKHLEWFGNHHKIELETLGYKFGE